MAKQGGESFSYRCKWPTKERFELRTTSLWDKIGLTLEVQAANAQLYKPVQNKSKNKRGFAIGVVDGGFWEDAPFFGPGQILGMRAFFDMYEVPPTREDAEHGTACASLLGCMIDDIDEGVTVKSGILRGGLPECPLRLYQVLNNSTIGIESAVHAALDDGVSLLSMSIGCPVNLQEQPYRNPIATATFAAMAKGVLACLPAGNDGYHGMVENYCPWEMTAAVCNSYKKVVTELKLLHMNESILGQSVNQQALGENCELQHVNDVLGPRRATASGKVIVLEVNDYGEIPDLSVAPFIGVAGLVVIGAIEDALLDHWLPAVVVNETDGEEVIAYMKDHKSKAKVMIMASVLVDDPDFPTLAECSSRLPNPLAGDISKPDISGEGGHVLCATVRITEDGRHEFAYKHLIGTSYATPVVCSVVAHVRLNHPDWSASAIKSAVMTTTTDVKWKNVLENFGMGSGLANATRAVDPGCVYDMDIHDYCKFVRGLENCSEILRELICDYDDGDETIHPLDLNYPSYMVTFRGKEVRTCKFNRKLKYVGTRGPATFKYRIKDGLLKVTVDHETLHFNKYGDELPFTVTVEVSNEVKMTAQTLLLQLIWSSQGELLDLYQVKSPVRVVIRDQ